MGLPIGSWQYGEDGYDVRVRAKGSDHPTLILSSGFAGWCFRQERQEQAPLVKQLEGDLATLMTEITTLNTTQASLQESIRGTKKQTTEVTDAVAQLTFQVETQLQDCNVLQSQIVQSPDRIKREIVERGDALTKEKGWCNPNYQRLPFRRLPCSVTLRPTTGQQNAWNTPSESSGPWQASWNPLAIASRSVRARRNWRRAFAHVVFLLPWRRLAASALACLIFLLLWGADHQQGGKRCPGNPSATTAGGQDGKVSPRAEQMPVGRAGGTLQPKWLLPGSSLTRSPCGQGIERNA
jgi:hypothetical protein